jgi:hypothetical protein
MFTLRLCVSAVKKTVLIEYRWSRVKSLILTALSAISVAATASHALSRQGIHTGALLFEFPVPGKEHLYGETGKSQPDDYYGDEKYL